MSYAAIQAKKNELIRKALNGSAFVAPYSSAAITNLTQMVSSAGSIATTLAANSSTGATSISSTATIPAGRTITIGAGGSADTVTTTGAPTGSGPYTIPVPALTHAHSSGDAVTAPAVVGGIDLAPLPSGYQDAGFMTSAGVVLAEAITTSETSSWGAVEPTRADITKETTTAHIVLQETKALTIGLYTGIDTSTVTADGTTGEVDINRPLTPSPIYYRLLSLAVDVASGGEIYVARFLPRCQVTSKGDQVHALQDDGITWDVTLTAFNDSVLGYSEKFIFGGPGWHALIAELGF